MSPRTPRYCLHKATGQAYVTLDGRERYLGRHGTPESLAEYDRLIGLWLAGGRTLVIPEPDPAEGKVEPVAVPTAMPFGPSIKEMTLGFLEHATTYYRRSDGTSTGELENLVDALRPVCRLFGDTPASRFGPLALKAVREDMIREGLSRTTINSRIHRIRRAFRWAASVEMIPAPIVQALGTVEGLKAGRTAAREADAIKPVPTEVVLKTLPYLNRVVAAMVRVHLLSPCRAGDIMGMRGRDLTMGSPNWEFRPQQHKTAHRGKARVIPLGPRAQEVLKPFLKTDLEAYLFDPRDVVRDMHARRGLSRKSRPTPSETAKRAADPGHGHADRYNRRTYRQAVTRACDRAFPHPTLAGKKSLTAEQHRELADWKKAHRWNPLQLRHNLASKVRARYGLELARQVFDHEHADTTLLYAEKDAEAVHRVMSEIG